jgi:hypothetical protein
MTKLPISTLDDASDADAVVAKSNGLARFEGPGRYAKDVDLGAEPMKSLITTMAQHKIVADPTLVVFENLMVPENGDLSPRLRACMSARCRHPWSVDFAAGGFSPCRQISRADYRASFAKLDLVGALHAAGVPIVAGTDGINGLNSSVSSNFMLPQASRPQRRSRARRSCRLSGRSRSPNRLDRSGQSRRSRARRSDPQVNIGDCAIPKPSRWTVLANADDLRARAVFGSAARCWRLKQTFRTFDNGRCRRTRRKTGERAVAFAAVTSFLRPSSAVAARSGGTNSASSRTMTSGNRRMGTFAPASPSPSRSALATSPIHIISPVAMKRWPAAAGDVIARCEHRRDHERRLSRMRAAVNPAGVRATNPG